MHYSLTGGDAFAALRVELQPNEAIKAEKNAMVAMSGHLKLGVKIDGGLLRGLARRFSGEGFFFQDIRAEDEAGWAMLAPTALGGITAVEMTEGNGITAEKGAFLAATSGITVSSTLQRLVKTMLGGEGFVVVKIGGSGTVFLSGFGAIQMLSLLPGQHLTVDNTHLIAWEDSVSYTMGRGGKSWMSAVLGGEGFVAQLHGPGRIWIQTRTPQGFHSWLRALSPPEKTANS